MCISMEETDGGTIQEVYGTVEWIQEELPLRVAEELEMVWQEIYAMAINLCPVETGALASSISLVGGATVTTASVEGSDIYNGAIFAGNPLITNPKTGKGTDEYALDVHDGHMMRNGSFYGGVPFLDMAVEIYMDELETAVDRALSDMGINTTEG